MDLTSENGSNNREDIEALYAKPMKVKSKKNTPSITSEQSEQLYDKLDRRPSNRMSERGLPRDLQVENEAINDDSMSIVSASRSIISQSGRSNMSIEGSEDAQQYPLDVVDTKDTNDVVRDLRELGLVNQAERLVSVLRNRFDLESQFIEACAGDGITIVEGDDDDADGEHKSIGGLRVKGMTANYVNYDEYDPDIIKKYGHFERGYSREEMANDAATLRRRAANLLWTVENMERMIDPNSRVRYVRQEET